MNPQEIQSTPKYKIGAQAMEAWNNDHPGEHGGYIMYTLGTIISMRWDAPRETWIYLVDIAEKGKEEKAEHEMSIFYNEANTHLLPERYQQ